MAGDEGILSAVEAAFPEGAHTAVLGDPSPRSRYRKVALSLKGDGSYMAEKLSATQAFHASLTRAEAISLAAEALGGDFRSLNCWTDSRENSLRVSSKGKLLANSRPSRTPPKPSLGHDRAKSRLLPEGAAIPPLVDMGIYTRSGEVVNSMRGKLAQVNRFLEIVADEVDKLPLDRPLRVIDFGCGKSYLTFALYYFLTEVRGREASMVGLDLKRDVVDRCNEAAAKYGYSGLSFEAGDIGGYGAEGGVDAVISLHACDTATDYALRRSVELGAKLIFCAPCCQHELNPQLRSEALSPLLRHGALRERFASLATDALRATLLEAVGYRAQILDFVDFGHTPKNLMIRAAKRGIGSARRAEAHAEAMAMCEALSLRPKLLELLREGGLIGGSDTMIGGDAND